MGMDLGAAVSEALGEHVLSLKPLGGSRAHGCYRLELAGGQARFLKVANGGPQDLFPCEAEGLAWLAEAGALQTPEVHYAGGPSDRWPAMLVLDFVTPRAVSQRTGEWAQQMGRGLANLHRSGAPSFGWHRDNYLASFVQDNRPCQRWADFYGEARLRPLVRMAADRGALERSAIRDFETLFNRLPERVGPEEPPARLHGDLWSGNALEDGAGRPVLIDPAVYGGHREVDLAMMRLFGGFGPDCFHAYQESFPLAPGHEARLTLYQLYPLLVHVLLFGQGYLAGLLDALAAQC